MISVPFVGPSYEIESINVDAQRCINLYPIIVDNQDPKTKFYLRRSPGLKLFTTLNGPQSVRGLYKSSIGRFFGVCGNLLNEILADGTVNTIGTLSTGETPASSTAVTMSDNGLQLIVVDGQAGYVFDFATNTFSTITDAGFPNGTTHIDFLDGFFICNVTGTGKFQWSDLDDGLSWPALNFATAEGSPDTLEALIVSGRRIWLLGSQSYEAWYNAGPPSTFLRFEGSFKNIGIAAKYSLARMNDINFWLGSNDQGHGQVWLVKGFDPQKVSTRAIDFAIQGYEKIDDAIGFCYQQEGSSFYQLSFPTANKTWVYDMSTSLWHEKSYRQPITGDAERHRAGTQAFFNGTNYVGDHLDGKLYELDLKTYSDNGDMMILNRRSPHYWNNLDRVYYAKFELDIETGVGLSTGQGSDPKITLTNSNDGGHNFGVEQIRKLGKQGNYRTRVIWNRQGASRDRVVDVTISDPIPVTILNAFVGLA